MALAFVSLLLLFVAPALQAQDSTLSRQSERQVRQYVQNIRHGQHSDLNIWALAEVSRSKPAIRSYINRFISKNRFKNVAFQVFQDTSVSYPENLRKLAFVNHSPFLLTAYLLAESNETKRQKAARRYANQIGYSVHSGSVNYRALIQALLRHKPVTNAILPAEHFYPVQFLLLFVSRPVRNNIVTANYLKKVKKNWKSSEGYPYQTMAQTLYRLTYFRVHYLLDDYGPSGSLYHSIINNHDLPNSLYKLIILRDLTYAMYRLGYYNRSVDIIQKHSLPLAQYLDKEDTVTQIRIADGLYLYYLGKVKESIKIYLQIKNSKEFKNHSISRARVLNNLAIDYFKSGQFNRYLNLEFKALSEAKKEDNYRSHLNALKNLFRYYNVNKDFSTANQYLTKAKQLAKNKQNNQDLAQLIFLEGQLYWFSQSNFKRALASYNQALNLISYKEDYRPYRDILNNKALLLERQGNYSQARAIYQRILHKAEKRGDTRYALFASFNKANTYLKSGEKDSARVILDSLRTKSLSPLTFTFLTKVKTIIARYQAQTGQAQEGIATLKPVIKQIVKRSRSSGSLETGFWQVQPEYLDAFQQYVNMLINANRQAQAVEALDQLKTINNVGLYRNPMVRSKVLSEKQLSDYKRLTNNLDALRKRLLAASKKKRSSIQQKINKLSARKNALDQKVTQHANRKSVSVRYIQQRLNAHQRVLDFTELKGMYYLAIISRTSVRFKKIDLTAAWRSRFKQSIAQLAHGNPNLKKLYAITRFLGLNKLPSQVRRLTVIPDSYLYQLPVDVLPLDPPAGKHSYGKARYLIERYKTNYITSLNNFRLPPDTTHYRYGYAGYGISHFAKDRSSLSPLPDAKTEIKASSRQLTAFHHKRVFFNDSATTRTFRQVAPHARILHLATHSKVSSRNPLFSTIYLSRIDSNDHGENAGRIFAYQLFNLHLTNQLIMLNSCESGSGSYLQGTGVVGISRALRYAGAQSLVLNLWSVNDMLASQFARKFYKDINKGESKSDAIRNTKLQFLNRENANPHFWGPYMLFGDTQPVVHPYKKANHIMAAAFMALFISLTAASVWVEIRKRQKRSD